MEKKRLLTSKLNMDLKKRIVKSTIWSVALYAEETWTQTESLRKKLKAFESWVRRIMLKISWTLKFTNEEVRKRIDEEKSILRTIQKRKHKWLGHVLRHDGILPRILEVKKVGKRQRGLRRILMIDDTVGKES